ncbi:hypothetical protein CDIK_1390 [Cucumispora dikerogammari]|nr:hypothetical protein CDIK_1390 [Cucumispora dikerogammari]
MKEKTQYELVFEIIDDMFPTIDEISVPLEKTTLPFMKITKFYPKTRKHKKIEEMKNKTKVNQSPRDNTFYENLVCSNKSCLFEHKTANLHSNDSDYKKTPESLILEWELTRIYTRYSPKHTAMALSSYILYVLIDTDPLDLIGENKNLKSLHRFLLDLSKYVTNDINNSCTEKLDYYLSMLDVLQEQNNIGGVESILAGIKNCLLPDEYFNKIVIFEKKFREKSNEMFLNNKNSLPSIEMLLNRLSNQTDSEEFVAIIDYFSNLEEDVFDENIEYDIFRTVEDFSANVNLENETYPLSYFSLI